MIVMDFGAASKPATRFTIADVTDGRFRKTIMMHQEVIRHPEQQNVNEKWNDQHDDGLLHLDTGKWRDHQVLDEIPEFELDDEGGEEFDDGH